MRLELANTTATLLEEIGRKESTRDDVASTYGLALISSEVTDWPAVNAAIIERWSISAMLYIKKAAWKRVEVAKREAAAREEGGR